jgi:hypothetical protein
MLRRSYELDYVWQVESDNTKKDTGIQKDEKEGHLEDDKGREVKQF